MSCICRGPPCLLIPRHLTLLPAGSQAPLIGSGRESCWRALQKGRCQSAAPASQVRGPHFHLASVSRHKAFRLSFLSEGLKVMRLTERGAFMASFVFSLCVWRRLSGTDIVFQKQKYIFNLKNS